MQVRRILRFLPLIFGAVHAFQPVRPSLTPLPGRAAGRVSQHLNHDDSLCMWLSGHVTAPIKVRMQIKPSSTPSMDDIAPAIPQLSWRRVFFFMMNPLALLPVALIVIRILGLNWLGSAFSAAPVPTLYTATLLAAPMLLVNQVADKLIPALAAVNEASKVISLYALGGGRLKPLRALVAAALISTAAAVAEEIAFRGMLQAGVEALLVWAALPNALATVVACVVQALVFGVLHSYTASPAYLITASVAGLAFGAAFACTHNLAIPIAMHFIIDVVGFAVCHYKVCRADEDEQRALVMMDSPIAASLRRLFPPDGR